MLRGGTGGLLQNKKIIEMRRIGMGAHLGGG